MSLLEKLGIRQPKVQDRIREKTSASQVENSSRLSMNEHVSEMLKKTQAKAKKYGGDPFYEYRKKGILPDKFEYGMNCYLDRIAEEQGGEVAQKVFDELKEIPGGCRITTSDSNDLPGIPILVDVSNLNDGLDAYNRAAEKLRIGRKAAIKLDKKAFIRMILEGSDLTFTVITQPTPDSSHAVLARPSDILLASEPWFVKAVDFQKKKQYEQAIEYYNKAIKTEPLDGRAWLNKGAIFSEQKNFEEAIECFDQVINIAPKMMGGVGWRNKADVLWNIGKYKESVECCDKALLIVPKNADIWNIKGVALIELKKYEEALECYNKALKISPNFDEAWLNKSEVLSEQKKWIEAVECIEKAIEINPKRTDSWKVLGDLATNLTEIGKFKKALECIDKAIQLEPSDDKLWNNKAAILISLERFEESEECSNRALEVNPKSAAAWLNKGSSLLVNSSASTRLAARAKRLNKGSSLFQQVKLDADKGSKDISASFVKYFKLASKLDPQMVYSHKEYINSVCELVKESLGEDYAYKLLVMTPKYLQKLEGETDTQYARKWTVICLGFFIRPFNKPLEPLENERFQFYFEVINKILSKQFSNYENNPSQGFHVNTPNANFGIGRWIAELLPSDEDPQFEKTVSILSESLLPELLPIVPDIKQEPGKENEYEEKFSSALPIVIIKLHDKISILQKEGEYLEERVWLTLKNLIIKKYIIEYHLDILKNLDKKVWVKVINDLIDLLRDENKEVHTKAIRTLGEIGEPAIGSLIEAFREAHKDVRTGLMATLKNIGEPAVNPLIMALKDENEKVRYYAATTLGIISESVAVNPLPLIDALRDENEKVRVGAIYALGEIGKPAIEPLIEALRDENWEVQVDATSALIEIGESAIEPLTAILNNNNENEIVRQVAALGLKKIVSKE